MIMVINSWLAMCAIKGKASTAPGVRDELDKLAAAVRDENFISNWDAVGITQEQRKMLLQMIGKSQWVSPFKQK